ncbi:hypothetical protein JCGZ_18998 [Jatropha curcas]|uniref:Uncharacterized protein n=2 Tax=Jatropha curcas TaxID=180498 RepID=A0A067JYP4_JATCU|nr:hypothetical protein JCGZ_18998 [Jatropha curcas]
MDLKFAKEHEMVKDFNETQSGKATQTGISRTDGSREDGKWLDKFSVTGHHQNLDIEEGQIVPVETVAEDRLEKKHASGRGAPLRNMKENFLSQNVRNGNEMKGYDDQQILDTIAKMERRRERFKDPVAQKKDPDKILKPPVDVIADKVETEHHRPARKRRWGGS